MTSPWPRPGRPGRGRARRPRDRVPARAVRRPAAAGRDRAGRGGAAAGRHRRRADRQPGPGDGLAGHEAPGADLAVRDDGPDRHPQPGHRAAHAAPGDHAGERAAGAGPAGGPRREAGLGVVVDGPFPPHRHGLLNLVRNTFRYLFAGAARAWLRNLGSTAPALGSMTLLLVLSGLVGLTAYGIQRLAATQASDAAVLHVYLRDDARQQDVDALRTRLAEDRRVDSV